MQVVYGEDCPGKSMIYKWHGLFKHGRESIEDDPHYGRAYTMLCMSLNIAILIVLCQVFLTLNLDRGLRNDPCKRYIIF